MPQEDVELQTPFMRLPKDFAVPVYRLGIDNICDDVKDLRGGNKALLPTFAFVPVAHSAGAMPPIV
jgi:hypothetical protein